MLSEFLLYVILALIILLTYFGLRRIFRILFKGMSCHCADKTKWSSCCHNGRDKQL